MMGLLKLDLTSLCNDARKLSMIDSSSCSNVRELLNKISLTFVIPNCEFSKFSNCIYTYFSICFHHWLPYNINLNVLNSLEIFTMYLHAHIEHTWNNFPRSWQARGQMQSSWHCSGKASSYLRARPALSWASSTPTREWGCSYRHL